ncbi:MAG: divalent-cation tolerance protein CutA [Chromatiales bacterium]|nr:divalent-cation tolerance protein CutA [Chromatiales bacterium]
MAETLLVFCTCPDQVAGESLAATLIEEKLAACVNLIPGLLSIYRWEGRTERSSECLLLIKSDQTHYPRLEMRLQELHPYELPEIIAVPVTRGLPGYLQWVTRSLE